MRNPDFDEQFTEGRYGPVPIASDYDVIIADEEGYEYPVNSAIWGNIKFRYERFMEKAGTPGSL